MASEDDQRWLQQFEQRRTTTTAVEGNRWTLEEAADHLAQIEAEANALRTLLQEHRQQPNESTRLQRLRQHQHKLDALMKPFNDAGEQIWTRVQKRAARQRYRRRHRRKQSTTTTKPDEQILRALRAERSQQIDEWRRRMRQRQVDERERNCDAQRNVERHERERRRDREKMMLRACVDAMNRLVALRTQTRKASDVVAAAAVAEVQSTHDEKENEPENEPELEPENEPEMEPEIEPENEREIEPENELERSQSCDDDRGEDDTAGDAAIKRYERNPEAFYAQADENIAQLIAIRRAWDSFLTRPGCGGSRIPQHFVQPPTPPIGSPWRQFLVRSNQRHQ